MEENYATQLMKDAVATAVSAMVKARYDLQLEVEAGYPVDRDMERRFKDNLNSLTNFYHKLDGGF